MAEICDDRPTVPLGVSSKVGCPRCELVGSALAFEEARPVGLLTESYCYLVRNSSVWSHQRITLLIINITMLLGLPTRLGRGGGRANAKRRRRRIRRVGCVPGFL